MGTVPPPPSEMPALPQWPWPCWATQGCLDTDRAVCLLQEAVCALDSASPPTAKSSFTSSHFFTSLWLVGSQPCCEGPWSSTRPWVVHNVPHRVFSGQRSQGPGHPFHLQSPNRDPSHPPAGHWQGQADPRPTSSCVPLEQVEPASPPPPGPCLFCFRAPTSAGVTTATCHRAPRPCLLTPF